MSARAPRPLLPFVVAAYLGLLAPLVVVIAVSFGPSVAFEFPPRGLTLHWFEAFFASQAFVTAFFRVSLLVGLLAAVLAVHKLNAVVFLPLIGVAMALAAHFSGGFPGAANPTAAEGDLLPQGTAPGSRDTK